MCNVVKNELTSWRVELVAQCHIRCMYVYGVYVRIRTTLADWHAANAFLKSSSYTCPG